MAAAHVATPIPAPGAKAWVTLLTRTSYLAGALVMNASLVRAKSAYPFVVFATPELPIEAREVLESQGIRVRDIAYLEPVASNKADLVGHDARFADTWTKLRCFEMVEYERVIMVDSDMLVTENMDELMTMDLPEGHIAAIHACACNPRKLAHYPSDWQVPPLSPAIPPELTQYDPRIPENCGHTLAKRTIPLSPSAFSKPTHESLNSGLVILRPSQASFDAIVQVLNFDPIVKTFGFPDQDLLAFVFKGKFTPLSYRYNALKTLRACHPDMWRDEDVKNLHFIMDKPWSKRTEAGDANAETHQLWWDAYDEMEKTWGTAPGWPLIASTVASK